MGMPNPGGATQVLIPSNSTGVFSDMITDINTQLAANPTFVPVSIAWDVGMHPDGHEFHSYHVEYYVGLAPTTARIVTGFRDESVTSIAASVNTQLAAHTNNFTSNFIHTIILTKGHHVNFALVYQDY